MVRPKRGEVWLVQFPFTDLTSTKLRPALVWAVHGEDVIVVGIFSRVPARLSRESWVLIETEHSEFSRIGPNKTSLLKAEKVAVVHNSVFKKKLGSLPKDVMVKVEEALKKALLIL
ncbi:MAG TPA: type II toxin-antitoxin system PemK/MazF family toxin [Desulfatiglandales bacterium]|nr:type II toxin-antitoxin system PemK/MazF family toxin [Desulfatiglandales bacterium]